MSESGQEVPSAKIRVPCPIDPTHTCFQNQLQKHLKICNARLEDQPPGLLVCEDFKIRQPALGYLWEFFHSIGQVGA